jgi:3-oxoacyl-(acyl-carrier-protein) synthase III
MENRWRAPGILTESAAAAVAPMSPAALQPYSREPTSSFPCIARGRDQEVTAVSVQLSTAPRANSSILGVGAYRPRREVPNSEVCTWMRSTPEWIETRSGIRSRRFAGEDESLHAMGVSAARLALSNARIRADQLDCVVVASMSNLVQTPPLAIAVASKLGAVNSAGFDISAACAGFCHALAIASDTVCNGGASYVLVVGVERMTDVVDRTDRGVAFMFADGAGAVVVGRSAESGIGPVVRGADGNSLDALRMSTSWAQFRANPTIEPPVMKMDGRRVFRWSIHAAAEAAKLALERAGVTVDQLSAFIPHQANLRIIEVLAGRLELPPHVAIARDVTETGNTSAASIPLAMEQLLASGAAPPGGAALLIGFGAGLNYAGQVVALPPAPRARQSTEKGIEMSQADRERPGALDEGELLLSAAAGNR